MLVALVNPATQAIIMVGLVPLRFPTQSRPIGFRFADRIWIATGSLTPTSPPRHIYVVAHLPKLEFIEDMMEQRVLAKPDCRRHHASCEELN